MRQPWSAPSADRARFCRRYKRLLQGWMPGRTHETAAISRQGDCDRPWMNCGPGGLELEIRPAADPTSSLILVHPDLAYLSVGGGCVFRTKGSVSLGSLCRYMRGNGGRGGLDAVGIRNMLQNQSGSAGEQGRSNEGEGRVFRRQSRPFPLTSPPLCSENAFSLSRDFRCRVRKIRMNHICRRPRAGFVARLSWGVIAHPARSGPSDA